MHQQPDFYDLSPLEPATNIIEAYIAVSEYIIAIIQNGGRPSGILSHNEFLTPNKKKEVQGELKELYKNLGLNGSIAIIEGEYKWEQIGVSPEKLQLLETKTNLAREISSLLGVPPILTGIVDATFTNYREARLYFLHETVEPLVQDIIHQLEQYLQQKINITVPNIQ